MDRSDSRYCVYCNSTFHRSCIIDHFYQNKYCPVCSKKMSLIFMRYGEPPQPKIKKREIPKEIRKPTWPHTERRTEVPVFEIDIPTGPLKKTDKYIPKPREKRKIKIGKVPKKAVAVIVVLAVAAVGVYYGKDLLLTSFSQETSPGSPWTIMWTYPLEGVTDIAASAYGVAVGGRNGLVVLDLEGRVLWQKQGEISDVDMLDKVIAAANRGVIEIYTVEGEELTRYGEGTCDSVSLSVYGLVTVGKSDSGVVLIDTMGTVIQEYETGPVSSVSIPSDGTVTAYREGRTVYILDIMGEVIDAFDDEGSQYTRIILTDSGKVFAQADANVFLYDEGAVLWSVKAGCEAGLAVSQDETMYAVNGDAAVLYSADGQILYELPKGSCGSIAFSRDDVVVSDASTVYYLQLEQVEAPEEEEQEEQEQEQEEQEEPATELGDYAEWFTWYNTFLSAENSCTYTFIAEEAGETEQEMQVSYVIEGLEGDNIKETITLIYETMDGQQQTSFTRWVGPDGNCVKAEMIVNDSVDSLECDATSIRGIDLRKILEYQDQFEYLGQEEITVERGTFLCHQLQINTANGVLTVWISDGFPPIRITLQEGDTVITMELA